jgi:DnaD/phage-associated family protein
VPNPLLASVLEEIDDLAELKLMLRLIWAAHRKRGFPKWVTAAELCTDRTVVRMLGVAGSSLETLVAQKLGAGVARGTLLKERDNGGALYCLNTEENRRAVDRESATLREVPAGTAETWADLEAAEPLPSVFICYEENIGPLTPLATGRLQQALESHTERELVEAIGIAVDANARNWNYISAVLRRQAYEVGTHGKPGRDPEKARSDEFIRRYVERQRARGNR